MTAYVPAATPMSAESRKALEAILATSHLKCTGEKDAVDSTHLGDGRRSRGGLQSFVIRSRTRNFLKKHNNNSATVCLVDAVVGENPKDTLG